MAEKIKYTPKEPRRRAPGRYTSNAVERMSEGAKKARTTESQKTKDERVQRLRTTTKDVFFQNFLDNNPLTEGGFYCRIILPGNHHRHFMVEGVIVSIDGENWHEVKDIKKRLLGDDA